MERMAVALKEVEVETEGLEGETQGPFHFYLAASPSYILVAVALREQVELGQVAV